MKNIKPKCRSCGAGSIKQKIRADHVFGGKIEHKFWQCDDCDLVYLWPVPSEEEEAHFYAQEFEKYMSSRAANDRDWSGAEAHIKANQDNVRRRLNILKPELTIGKEVLEIGCSSGFMLDAFREIGLKPVGVEPSQKFLAFLRDKGFEAYDSLEKLKTIKRKFDLIVSFFVFEHIRNTEEFIREQIGLINRNGKIIAEVPCVNDPLTSIYKIPAFERFYWSIAHHYYFNPKSLSRILDRIDCEYEFFPEQRYDLSNHLVWMMEGKPGGQGRYSHVFSEQTLKHYKNDLDKTWNCDTFFVYIKPKVKTENSKNCSQEVITE